MNAKAVESQLPSASWNGIRFASKKEEKGSLLAPGTTHHPRLRDRALLPLSSPHNKSAVLIALGVERKGWWVAHGDWKEGGSALLRSEGCCLASLGGLLCLGGCVCV